MALQEYFTRADGYKFILRQSNEGRWTVKCLAPPPEGEKVWPLLWEYVGTPDPADPLAVVPLTEAQARAAYEGYMG